MFLHLSVILFRGRCLPQCMLGYPLGRNPPWADTPLDRHPPGPTPPAQCMLGYTPPCQVHSGIHPPCPVHSGIHPPAQCMLGSTWLLLRTVHILLECILVIYQSTLFGKWSISMIHLVVFSTKIMLFQFLFASPKYSVSLQKVLFLNLKVCQPRLRFQLLVVM